MCTNYFYQLTFYLIILPVTNFTDDSFCTNKPILLSYVYHLTFVLSIITLVPIDVYYFII